MNESFRGYQLLAEFDITFLIPALIEIGFMRLGITRNNSLNKIIHHHFQYRENLLIWF